jgi:hypothetical protein
MQVTEWQLSQAIKAASPSITLPLFIDGTAFISSTDFDNKSVG